MPRRSNHSPVCFALSFSSTFRACSVQRANAPRLSLLLSSTSAHHTHDRNALNSFALKHLRTAFFATEGWGGSATGHFKYHLNSGSPNCRPSTRLTSLECAVPRLRLLTLLECAVAKNRPRNPFRMRSSEKKRGEGGPPYRFSKHQKTRRFYPQYPASWLAPICEGRSRCRRSYRRLRSSRSDSPPLSTFNLQLSTSLQSSGIPNFDFGVSSRLSSQPANLQTLLSPCKPPSLPLPYSRREPHRT